MRRIVISHTHLGITGKNILHNGPISMHSQHTEFLSGLGFQIGHMFGTRIKNMPGNFRRVDTSKTKANELT